MATRYMLRNQSDSPAARLPMILARKLFSNWRRSSHESTRISHSKANWRSVATMSSESRSFRPFRGGKKDHTAASRDRAFVLRVVLGPNTTAQTLLPKNVSISGSPRHTDTALATLLPG